MRKAFWKLILTLGLLAVMCAVCLPAFAEHTHNPSAEWDRDAVNHWRNCDCGEMTELSAHVMEDTFCTVCGSKVWVYDDGTADVYDYFDNGNLRRNTFYDVDGTVFSDYRYEYGYDDAGCMLWSKTWLGDLLCEEVQYAVSADGESIPTEQKGYNEDGTWACNEYDLYGNVTCIRTYTAEVAVVFEETYEYTYLEEGLIAETKISGRFDDGSSYVWVDNQYGDRVSSIMYEADGSISMNFATEIGYDELGNKQWYKRYSDGVLMEEAVYALYTDEAGSWSYEQRYTEYLEDGGKIVIEYDHEGGEVSRTECDAQGNVTE